MKHHPSFFLMFMTLFTYQLTSQSIASKTQEDFTLVKTKTQQRLERLDRKEKNADILDAAVEVIGDAVYPEHKTHHNYLYLRGVLRAVPLHQLEQLLPGWELTFTPDNNPSYTGLLTFSETLFLLDHYKTWDVSARNDRLQVVVHTYDIFSRVPAIHSMMKGITGKTSAMAKFIMTRDPIKLIELCKKSAQFKEVTHPKLPDISPLDPIIAYLMEHSSTKALNTIKAGQTVMDSLSLKQISMVRAVVNRLRPDQYRGVAAALEILAEYDDAKWCNRAPELLMVLSNFSANQIEPIANAIMSQDYDVSRYNLGWGDDGSVLNRMDKILKACPYALKTKYTYVWAELIVQFRGLPAPGVVEANELWGKPKWALAFVPCGYDFLLFYAYRQEMRELRWPDFLDAIGRYLGTTGEITHQMTCNINRAFSTPSNPDADFAYSSDEDGTQEATSEEIDILQGRRSVEDDEFNIVYN